MKLEEKKVEFGKLMNACIAYLTPEECLENFKELVSTYVCNLEAFSECDVNNMSDTEYGDILARLYDITFYSDDFLTVLSDQKGRIFDRIETIKTNMAFEYENTNKNSKVDKVYGHLCFNVAVAKDFDFNVKKVYSASKLKKLESENMIALYSKNIILYDSIPGAKLEIIKNIPNIQSLEVFDRLSDEEKMTQEFNAKIDGTEYYSLLMEYLRLWFHKRKLLVDMKSYVEEFNKQFKIFIKQDDEIVKKCKDWFDKSIVKRILQKVNKNTA